ncbi:MAG: hypothetical protein HKN58_10230, partial [Xanthomonadales bacterium]|nr:hypothetical protein [Xanthomonadales bacterium]
MLIALASALLLEAGARVYFSVRVGPDVLLYGTRWHRDAIKARYMRGQNVFEHDNDQPGYSKYFPKQARRDVGPDGVPFEVTINAHGFRGRDYTPDKPP